MAANNSNNNGKPAPPGLSQEDMAGATDYDENGKYKKWAMWGGIAAVFAAGATLSYYGSQAMKKGRK